MIWFCFRQCRIRAFQGDHKVIIQVPIFFSNLFLLPVPVSKFLTCSLYIVYISLQYDCYTDIRTGAETGWDYTSRWFYDKDGDPSHDLSDIGTRRNIPVDLNSYLYKCFTTMTKFYSIMQQNARASYWEEKANQWRTAIENVLYHEEDGIWWVYFVFRYTYWFKVNMPAVSSHLLFIYLFIQFVKSYLSAQKAFHSIDVLVCMLYNIIKINLDIQNFITNCFCRPSLSI